MASLIKDERAQMLVFFSLIVATIIAYLSVLHAQNMLAGIETSRTLMVFPKEEIRNLKVVGERGIMMFIDDPAPVFMNKTSNISDQIKLLYARKGVYGDVIAFTKSELCYSVRITYVSGEVEFSDLLYCCKGRGCV